MAKQYKLKFKPTPISRLLKRPATPIKMVGYPYASNWARYYALNYEYMSGIKRRERIAAQIREEHGPFVADYADI